MRLPHSAGVFVHDSPRARSLLCFVRIVPSHVATFLVGLHCGQAGGVLKHPALPLLPHSSVRTVLLAFTAGVKSLNFLAITKFVKRLLNGKQGFALAASRMTVPSPWQLGTVETLWILPSPEDHAHLVDLTIIRERNTRQAD